MANLEARDQISPTQFAIIIFSVGIGGEMMGILSRLVDQSEHDLWQSIFVGGLIFGTAAVGMVKLGEMFPGKTLVAYIPLLWGRRAGSLLLIWYVVLLMLLCATSLATFTKAISLFLFDRTPNEVVAMALLLTCVYGAVQDWGTFVRVQQFIIFFVVPFIIGLWLLAILNFRIDNLLPLRPANINHLFSSSLHMWNLFTGYELILVMAVIVNKGKRSVSRAVVAGFAWLIAFHCAVAAITIGVLTTEGAKSLEYPALAVLRSVELPGTFVERLENYLLLTWVPLVFNMVTAMLLIPARVLTEWRGEADHRPWVLALAPVVFVISSFVGSLENDLMLYHLTTWLGVAFSLGVVPVSIMLSLKRKRGLKPCRVRE